MYSRRRAEVYFTTNCNHWLQRHDVFQQAQWIVDCKHKLVCMITGSGYDFSSTQLGRTHTVEVSTNKTHDRAW